MVIRCMSCDLTVCICAYNAEKYIAETLESLSKQTFKDFKLLIVNDCSTDRTVNVAESFADSGWCGFEIVSMEKNRGTAYCRNFALNYTDTDYMMFFDADDIALPDLIKTLVENMRVASDLIAVGCYCRYMDATGKKLRGGIFLGPTDKEQFDEKAQAGKMFFLTLPTVFVRKYALAAGGYRQAEWFPAANGFRYEDLSEDVDLWGRMSDFYSEDKWMKVVPEVLYFYRKISGSLSSGFKKSRAMGQKIKYIKSNQLRRRAGLPEEKFDIFWQRQSLFYKLNFERINAGSFLYRSACFSWIEKHFLRTVLYLLAAGLIAPEYPLEKYRSNFKKNKK